MMSYLQSQIIWKLKSWEPYILSKIVQKKFSVLFYYYFKQTAKLGFPIIITPWKVFQNE
jgi:hypothetical protein